MKPTFAAEQGNGAFVALCETHARCAGIVEDDGLRWVLLGCVAFLYLPFIFMGPGSNPDSIRELHSGATLVWRHRYIMSRPPGYFPYEALCGILYAVGGTAATNLATAAMSLMMLDCFLRICAHLQVPHRYLLVTTMAVHPIYWASSTSTIDYIWALGCFLLGFRMLLGERHFAAGAMLGLAIGIRLSSIVLVTAVLIYALAGRPRDTRLWAAAGMASVVGAALYIPEFIASGDTLGFVTYYPGAWNFTERLGRFIYKNVYFWGLPATLFLLAATPIVIRRLAGCERNNAKIVILSASIVVGLEAMFLDLPVQRAYLLPTLPFVLIIVGLALGERAPMLFALLLLVFSYNFVNVNLARPDVVDHATRAITGPFIESGYLLNDVAARLERRNVVPQVGR